MICFKTEDGWSGRLFMNGVRWAALAVLTVVLVVCMWGVSAWAGQGKESSGAKAKVATVVYTCNTWGYLKHCST